MAPNAPNGPMSASTSRVVSLVLHVSFFALRLSHTKAHAARRFTQK